MSFTFYFILFVFQLVAILHTDPEVFFILTFKRYRIQFCSIHFPSPSVWLTLHSISVNNQEVASERASELRLFAAKAGLSRTNTNIFFFYYAVDVDGQKINFEKGMWSIEFCMHKKSPNKPYFTALRTEQRNKRSCRIYKRWIKVNT